MESNPLIVSSSISASSRRWQQGDLDILKECDSISAFSECGYFCVLGFKETNRKIYLHFNESQEWYDTLGASGYAYNGMTVEPSENARKVYESRYKQYRGYK